MPSSAVGARAETDIRVDARWLMAYSVAVGATGSEFVDTQQGIIAHPLFPVAPEWALLTGRPDPFGFGLTREETARGVHAGHDLHWHSPIVPGEQIHLVADVVAIRAVRAGSLTTVRFTAFADDGAPRWTTWMDNINRGVEVEGADSVEVGSMPPPLPENDAPLDLALPLSIAAGAAHVYTECARIWNPIHTDVAVARAAGLPDILLHGTATLAMSVTTIMAHRGIRAEQVRRLAGSFRSMVLMPAQLDVMIGTAPNGTDVHFSTDIAGTPAVLAGLIRCRWLTDVAVRPTYG